jgi:hypothetical protein
MRKLMTEYNVQGASFSDVERIMTALKLYKNSTQLIVIVSNEDKEDTYNIVYKSLAEL